MSRIKFYFSAIGGEIEQISLTQHQMKPEIPKGMSVEGCIAVLLTFSTKQVIEKFDFSAKWESLDTQGSGCTGEGLFAWEWEAKKYIAIVGTEDADWLAYRIPLQKFEAKDYPIIFEKNEMTIHVETLPPCALYSFHYVIAWNQLPEPVDCSCWYAVDIPRKLILGLKPTED